MCSMKIFATNCNMQRTDMKANVISKIAPPLSCKSLRLHVTDRFIKAGQKETV